MFLGSCIELCPTAFNALQLHCDKTGIIGRTKECQSSGSFEILLKNSTQLLGALI